MGHAEDYNDHINLIVEGFTQIVEVLLTTLLFTENLFNEKDCLDCYIKG